MSSAVHIASFQKGDHICVFYSDADEQMSTLVPFVQLGLGRNERCFCVLPQDGAQKLLVLLQSAGIDTAWEIERGALLLMSPEQTYLRGGGFDRARMLALIESALAEALAAGFTAFRIAGDLGWAALEAGCCAELPEYESMVEQFFPGKPAVGLCMYDTRLFSDDELRRLMRTHRLALTMPNDLTRVIRVRMGDVFGDITFAREGATVFHYQVQRGDSAEPVAFGQETSLGAALIVVESSLRVRQNA
jgi:hypothetical protein